MLEQQAWRLCRKCEAMFFDGSPNKGKCAAGGSHEASGFNFVLPHVEADTPTSQKSWRFCRKCEAMFFDGSPDKGRCAAGGSHEASGFNFVLPHDVPGTPTAQQDWRFCQKCEAMLGSVHETESIPLTEYCPIFRVPEYSELSVRPAS